MWVAFANAKATYIFSAKLLAYMTFNDQCFNDTLTNDIVSFEQLGPDHEIPGSNLTGVEFSWAEFHSGEIWTRDLVYGMHRAFHYHTSIVTIYLK